MTDTDNLLAECDRQRSLVYRHVILTVEQYDSLRAEIERLRGLRCPRCGEWVRDFPRAVSSHHHGGTE